MTGGLKEYQPALCEALSSAFLDVLTQQPGAEPLPESFVQQISSLVDTDFGDYMGQDHAR